MTQELIASAWSGHSYGKTFARFGSTYFFQPTGMDSPFSAIDNVAYEELIPISPFCA
jgi:hypothetical protein